MVSARTGLRSLCVISILCRYSNPFAASASFSHILEFGFWSETRDQAYETKAVDLRVLRREVHDVSVNHPFSDDT